MISEEQLEEIRRGLERVEKEEWMLDAGMLLGEDEAVISHRGMTVWRLAECRDRHVAAHIVKMNPITTIRLLNEIDRLKREIAAAVKASDAVRFAFDGAMIDKNAEIESLEAGISAQDEVLTSKYNEMLALGLRLESENIALKAQIEEVREWVAKEQSADECQEIDSNE